MGSKSRAHKGNVKLILTIRGKGAGEMEVYFGTSRRITALAPFGAKTLSGLLRRPQFVAGEATIKAVAVNAWQWAEEGKAKIIQQHMVSYSGFKRGAFKAKEVELKLAKAVEKRMK